MNNEDNLEILNVSRETMELINIYVMMLKSWNKTINLISRGSMIDVWHRHIQDSAQLIHSLDQETTKWVDLGSGAGFPGIIISILAKRDFPKLKTTLIESDRRKCVFLSEVSRELGLNVTIISNRIEDCSNLKADIVSARALAPMKKLLNFFDMHSTVESKGLFLKGKNLWSELKQIRKIDNINIKIKPSVTNKESFIVEVDKRGFVS